MSFTSATRLAVPGAKAGPILFTVDCPDLSCRLCPVACAKIFVELNTTSEGSNFLKILLPRIRTQKHGKSTEISKAVSTSL